jgi:hypothetical protein
MISVILFVYLIQDIEEAGFFDIFTRLFFYYSSFNLFIFHFFIYPFIYIYIYTDGHASLRDCPYFLQCEKNVIQTLRCQCI